MSAYISSRAMDCFVLERHDMAVAVFFTLPNAGRSIPASTAMMAMTTRSSMRVNSFLFMIFSPILLWFLVKQFLSIAHRMLTISV